MRLIDADSLLKNYNPYIADMIENAPTVDPVWDEIQVCSTEVIDGIAYINLKADDIDNAPTVEAEPVVRCKDCKFYQFADNRAFGMIVKHCEITGFEDVDDFDFCSRAEREGER